MVKLRKRLEDVWTHRWAGVTLTVVFTTIAACLLHWLPAPGVSVAVMGLAAAVVSLRAKATGTEKAVWMLLVTAFIVIEVGAIKKDRLLNEIAEAQRVEEQRQHFSEIGEGIKDSIARSEDNFNATMKRSDKLIGLEHHAVSSLGENLKTSTGGDSFCYLDIQPQNQMTIVACSGKYPLYDVGVRIVDTRLITGAKDIQQAMGTQLAIGNMAANTARILTQAIPFSSADKQDFNVFFGARNGFWTELLRYRKVKDRWVVARMVESSLNPRYPKGVVVHRVVDKEFPVGDLKQDTGWQDGEKLPHLKSVK
jgi:hypothetical protein